MKKNEKKKQENFKHKYFKKDFYLEAGVFSGHDELID